MKKKCATCSKIKPLSEFYKCKKAKDGHNSWCKPCQKIYVKEYHKKHKIKQHKLNKIYRENNKNKIRTRQKRWCVSPRGKKLVKAQQIKYLYDLTLDEHKQIYIDQNGQCAICGIPTAYDKIKTDHDHKTGKVRGLLCHRCNALLAGLDDKDFFEQATKYLRGE